MVPSAYLRVYQPLDALPVAERDRWRRRLSQGAGIVGRAAAPRIEARTTRAGLLPGHRPTGRELAIVRRVGERIHVCPLELDLRAAAALADLRERVPAPVVEAVVPDAEARAALEALSRAGHTPHVRDAAWEVPAVWYAAFDPGERHFTDPPEGRGPRVTYLTRVEDGRARLSRAVAILEDGPVETGEEHAALSALEAWLGDFAPDSLLELDYATLSEVLGRDRLQRDRSCDDVWSALRAIERGDGLAAAAHYGAVRTRWEVARRRGRSS